MDDFFDIEDIFVGRIKELKELQDKFHKSLKGKENKVYAVLNAPGVGKTTLLHYFGKQLMKERKGLMVEIKSQDNKNTIFKYLSHTLEGIQESIPKKRKLILEYIKIRIKEEKEAEDDENSDRECYFYSTEEEAVEALESIEKSIKILTKRYEDIELGIHPDPDNPKYLSSSFPGLIEKLSNIIPVFLFIDEIQELQPLNYINMKKEEETFLHLCSSELADLLKSKVLIAVSGTQYRLMKELGYGLGSPLLGKVKHFVIHPLEIEHLQNYHNQISEHFLKNYTHIPNPEITLSWYYQMIKGYSGGHARTLMNLTDKFLELYEDPTIIKNTYEDFLNLFIKMSVFNNFYPDLSERVKNELAEFQTYVNFPKVHHWIMSRAVFGAKLYQRPDHEEDEEIEEIETMANTLVQIGILMINGNNNYYLTSYFHLYTYINALKDDGYAMFLKEILKNKYFKLMCGYHSGIGYVFEEIVLATIMKLKDSKNPEVIKKIPFDINKTYGIIKLTKKVDYSTLKIENNAIYHTPQGAGVDFIINDNNKIVLIQVTTIQTVDVDKMASMDGIYKALEEKYNGDMLKWFISLSPISKFVLDNLSKETNINLLISSAENLMEIIGKPMYDRITSIKKEFLNQY